MDLNYTDNSPNYTDNSTLEVPIPESVAIVFIALQVFDKLLAALTNGFTFFILCKYTRLETSSNVFVCCLAVTGIFFAASLPFNLLSMYLPPGPDWTFSCFGQLFMTFTASMMNSLALCVIAIDRLLYIVYSLEYHSIVTVKRAQITVCVILVLSVLYNVACVSIGYLDNPNKGPISRPCNMYYSLKEEMKNFVGLPFVLFAPVTIGCYIKIGYIAFKQKRAIAAEGPAPLPAVANQSDYKVTRVMLNVLLIYLFCHLIIFLQPVWFHYLQSPMLEVFVKLTFLIWRTNMWINPVIYAWKSEKFRQHVNAFFRCGQVNPEA